MLVHFKAQASTEVTRNQLQLDASEKTIHAVKIFKSKIFLKVYHMLSKNIQSTRPILITIFSPPPHLPDYQF